MIKKSISFQQMCPTIDISFETIKEENAYSPDILSVKVIGKYRHGSSGDDDAKLIKGMIDVADDLWNPKSLMLDLSEFEYKWGDYIDIIFDGPEGKKPFVIVVGPKCRSAISTLIHGLESHANIVDNQLFFNSADEATKRLLLVTNGN